MAIGLRQSFRCKEYLLDDEIVAGIYVPSSDKQ